jgi:hypothetical protein
MYPHKIDLPDVFLNTNNSIISEVFGFNNNVTTGKRNCIYWVPAETRLDTYKSRRFLGIVMQWFDQLATWRKILW